MGERGKGGGTLKPGQQDPRSARRNDYVLVLVSSLTSVMRMVLSTALHMS